MHTEWFRTMQVCDRFLSNISAMRLPAFRTENDQAVIAKVREQERRLSELDPSRFREQSDLLRKRVSQESPDSPGVRIDAFAVMCEALRRARTIHLYDVQLLAALALSQGAIAEMQTGEGKTFACAPAAYLHALTGRGVHVATPNQYLAKRDYEALLPAYKLLGIDTGLLPEREGTPADKRAAYRCDITYGTGFEFGFDYLRDQLTVRQQASRTLGAKTQDLLFDSSSPSGSLIQRELYYSIIDEADNVLLDDATSPLILSGSAEGEAADAEVHRVARSLVGQLRLGEHYRMPPGSTRFMLTDAGIAWIHNSATAVPIDRLQRTWTEYVEQALHAVVLRRDVHYIVTDAGKVQIVDTSTGRIFSDRTWREGLHQAVEAKEGVTITPEKLALAQITRQRFSRMYQRLAGMTGTAAGCEREFKQVYGLRVVPIPLRTPSRRQMWPTRFFVDRQQKWNAIAESVLTINRQQRPVLVGTTSIADSEHLARLLRERGLQVELLNGRQDADEAAIVANAGQQGIITIATSLAGRGTDIKLGDGVFDLGGLHVIISECGESERVDRQLVGRCARQGDSGSAQMFVSAEDSVIQLHGSWLIRSIARNANQSGEANSDFSAQLRRIQRSCERMSYSARCNMLRRDLSRESLFSRQTLDS
jgi:preprotein translocase subunit SecA